MMHILGSFLLSVFVYGQSVQSGIWQADSVFDVSGMQLPPSHEEQCITAGDAKDIRKAITKELEKQGCSTTKWKVTGQKVEVSLTCSKSGLEADGNLRGTFSLKTYNLSGEAEGTYHGIPAQANIVLKGKWLKNCAK